MASLPSPLQLCSEEALLSCCGTDLGCHKVPPSDPRLNAADDNDERFNYRNFGEEGSFQVNSF